MRLRIFNLVIILTILNGCSSQVKINDPDIPKLLINQLPYTVAIIYPENFDSFIHEEKVIGKKSWQVDFTRSNILLFNEVFRSFFTTSKVIETPDTDTSDNFDFTIYPSIDAIEFSVPEQSQDETFSVWIRYRVKIFDYNGEEIVNWPISAYGKTSTSTFSDEQDLAQAAILAMRDAAALIILQLEKTQEFNNLQS